MARGGGSGYGNEGRAWLGWLVGVCVGSVAGLWLYAQMSGPRRLDAPIAAATQVGEWSSYGGDLGGQRYVASDLITPDNVSELGIAWIYETGDYVDGRDGSGESAFEATPILADGTLYLCTPFNRVIALDPATGAERWVFDPEIDRTRAYANQMVCRGVSAWRDRDRGATEPCARTIFTTTNDARLIALDAGTGLRCEAFGRAGEIDLARGVGETRWDGEYQLTSAPTVAGDLLIVGSAISDNQRIDAPSGVVRAFDARSGRQVWAWDLAPPDYDHAIEPVSEEGFALGTPNVWAPMSVDAQRDLVFVPTGNAAPDFYRGERARMNHFGSSVVALRGATGEVVWHFATVHTDLWDYDVAAQPSLTTISQDGRARDVVVQATKMGLVFVLDRETGEPVFGVEERPVPQKVAPGEAPSPAQPFPLAPPPLVRTELRPDDAYGFTPWDRQACRDRIESLDHDGIYTPPTLRGTIMYPGNAGGVNWGGIAIDPVRQIAIARANDLPFVVTLIERDGFEAARAAAPGVEHSAQTGTPYGMRRQILGSPLGLPCNPPPWGVLTAIDLARGELLWQVPHGTVRDLAPIPLPLTLGVPGLGGPIVTSTGVIFVAAAADDYLRGFALETGAELWRARLPAGGQATPMSYSIEFADGSARQYVLIAAGGHSRAGTTLGGSVVAFALEKRAAPDL